MMKGRGRETLRHKVDGKLHVRIYEGLRGDGDEKIFAWLNGAAKSLELRFRVSDLDLPEGDLPVVERREQIYRSSPMAKQQRAEVM